MYCQALLFLLFRISRRIFQRTRRAHGNHSTKLRLLPLEGRLVPSQTPFDIPDPSISSDIILIRTDETSLDGLVRFAPWIPTGRSTWTVDDGNQLPRESPAPLSVAAFMALFLGAGAVLPYDREEDAETRNLLHGVKVA